MKQIALIMFIFVIGMCVQNGYYYESDSDWNTDPLAKIKYFSWNNFNKVYPEIENKLNSEENKNEWKQ